VIRWVHDPAVVPLKATPLADGVAGEGAARARGQKQMAVGQQYERGDLLAGDTACPHYREEAACVS
jgi:hypothetical protein